MKRIFVRRTLKILVFLCLSATISSWLYFHAKISLIATDKHTLQLNGKHDEHDNTLKEVERKEPREKKVNPNKLPPKFAKPVSECSCVDNVSSIEYDFCYRFGPTSGQKFSCSYLPYLKDLGLLDYKDAIDLGQEMVPEYPVLVSAASESHFNEVERLISLVQKWLPNHKMVLYDLGISETNRNNCKSYCQVELRIFPFNKYPDYVKRLNQFRWKPIIIAEALKEFGSIWYMDSSVTWKKHDLSHVYALLNCKTNPMAGPRPVPVSRPDQKWVESGFHMDLWRDSLWKCDKYAYMLQGWTGHGIYPATHQGVYKYFPTDKLRLKKENAKMYEAGFVLAVRTQSVIEEVLKWYVLCALEPDCMGPPGATLGCRFTGDRYSQHAGCHRFDQSVVNLLLANVNQFDSYYYVSGIVDFFNIVRGRSANDQLHMCRV